MSKPKVNSVSLAGALVALQGNDLNQIKSTINQTLNDLHAQILNAIIANPPQNTTDLQNQYDLANSWLRALNDATNPNSPPNANQTLLSAIQAVDVKAASAAALNSLLVAVDGLVKSFGP